MPDPPPPSGGIDNPFSVLGLKEKNQKGEKLPESTVESGNHLELERQATVKSTKSFIPQWGQTYATRKGLPVVTAPPRYRRLSATL